MRQINILEELFRRSRFCEGIRLIESYEKDFSYSNDERALIQIKKIKFLEKRGKYSEALFLADSLLNNQEINSKNVLFCQILIERSKVLFSMGDMKKTIKNIEMAEQKLFLCKKEEDPEVLNMMATLILLIVVYFWQSGELDNALYYFKLNLKLR